MKTDAKLSAASTPSREARGDEAGQQQLEANGARQDEIGNRWKRLNQHHQAAGQAFLHTVIAGIEVVQLKLLLPHGSFAKLAQEQIPGLAGRTVRRYRQIAEWYLSAAHGRVATVSQMHEDGTSPQEEICTDEFVSALLNRAHIWNADDLRAHALEKVPDLAAPNKRKRSSRVDNLMQKVRRAWSHMSDEQKAEFVRRFNEYRVRPAKDEGADSTSEAPSDLLPDE